MSTIISIVIIAIVIIVLIVSWMTGKSTASRPEFSENDYPEINNDKGILIEGPIYSEVKEACMDFCEMINEMEYHVIIKLVRIDPNTCLLLFPYEIDFKYYCYLLNYLEFPLYLKFNAKVTGWLTSKKIDQWIDNRSVNKRIMVYNAADKINADLVYFTTMDQIGYIVEFSSNEKAKELPSPVRRFESCKRCVDDLNILNGELIVSKS